MHVFQGDSTHYCVSTQAPTADPGSGASSCALLIEGLYRGKAVCSLFVLLSLVLRWQDTTTVENPQATARRPVTWWKRWHRISKSTPRLRSSTSATFAPGVGPFSPHRVLHCQTPLLVLKRDRHDHVSPAYGACGSSSGRRYRSKGPGSTHQSSLRIDRLSPIQHTGYDHLHFPGPRPTSEPAHTRLCGHARPHAWPCAYTFVEGRSSPETPLSTYPCSPPGREDLMLGDQSVHRPSSPSPPPQLSPHAPPFAPKARESPCMPFHSSPRLLSEITTTEADPLPPFPHRHFTTCSFCPSPTTSSHSYRLPCHTPMPKPKEFPSQNLPQSRVPSSRPGLLFTLPQPAPPSSRLTQRSNLLLSESRSTSSRGSPPDPTPPPTVPSMVSTLRP